MKKITLENLAVMIQKGFEENGKRFDNVEQRFGNVEQKLNEYLEEIRFIKFRLDAIEKN